MQLTDRSEWKALKKHYNKINDCHLKDFFSQNPRRAEEMTFLATGLRADFSKNRWNRETFRLLMDLANAVDVKKAISSMFSGGKINQTEDRAVLHVALRNCSNHPIFVDGEDVMPKVNRELQKMKELAQKITTGVWKGYSGKSIKNVVNIGIGGSDLGPVMVYEALKYYSNRDISLRFVSNVDATHLSETLRDLDPAETLFIIASKTFTTQETMTNAQSAKEWVLNAFGEHESVSKHFVALSTNREKVIDFGIGAENILEFWDWVGGRYSLMSAIGFSIMIGIGIENFEKLREGFHQMDQHFLNAPLRREPCQLSLVLLGVWYNNFFEAETQADYPL